MEKLDHHHQQALSLPSSFYQQLQLQPQPNDKKKQQQPPANGGGDESRPAARLFNSLSECRSTRGLFRNAHGLGPIQELRESGSRTPSPSSAAAINSSRPLSGRQIATIFALIYGNFWVAACVSLQAPFYPKEAEAKGKQTNEPSKSLNIYDQI